MNDGSQDNTQDTLLKIQQHQGSRSISIVTLSQNQGKAEATRQGILYCLKNGRFEQIGYLDGDLSTPLEEWERVRSHLRDGKEFAFGSRILKVGSKIERKTSRHYVGRFVATLISNVLQLGVYDSQCGCKAFTRELAGEVFKEPFISSWLFDVEIFFRIFQVFTREKGEDKMVEVPLNEWKDPGGSKISPFYTIGIWKDLFLIKRQYKIRKS